MIYYAIFPKSKTKNRVKFRSDEFYYPLKNGLAKYLVKSSVVGDDFIFYMKNFYLHSMRFIQINEFEIIKIYSKKETDLIKEQLSKLMLLK